MVVLLAAQLESADLAHRYLRQCLHMAGCLCVTENVVGNIEEKLGNTITKWATTHDYKYLKVN